MNDCYYDIGSNSIADLVYTTHYNAWVITRINVPKAERGKGNGTALLKKILADADREGIVLCLAVSGSDGLDNEQLLEWYKRHGFHEDGDPKWTGIKASMMPEIVRRYVLRRDPQPVMQIDVILKTEEVDFLRAHPRRCECGHLMVLHTHFAEYAVYECQVCETDCRDDIFDDEDTGRPGIKAGTQSS